MNSLRAIIQFVFQILSLVVIADVLLSYFLPYDNRIRLLLDKIVGPMLAPIRKIILPVGNIDFSPVILLVAIQIIETILLRLV